VRGFSVRLPGFQTTRYLGPRDLYVLLQDGVEAWDDGRGTYKSESNHRLPPGACFVSILGTVTDHGLECWA
jgi:hypothetical protein